MFVTLWGCSDASNSTVVLDPTGKHPGGWIAPSTGGLHPAEYKANQSACIECHGSAQNPLSTGGITGISCFTASFNGIACHPNGPSGHPSGWNAAGNHGNAAKATPDSSHGFASCTQCHGEEYNGSAGTSCMSCHTTAPHPAAPWKGTTSTGTTHTTTDQANAPECSRCHAGGVERTTPVAVLANAGCFNNTLCHGSVSGHPVGWSDTGHQSAAKASAGATSGLDYCRTCHGTDFRGGTAAISCFGCHTSSPHAVPWLGSTGATTYLHSTADESNAPSCGRCHAGGAKLTTPTPPPANAGCFNNTLCHGTPASGHAFPNPGSLHLSVAGTTPWSSCAVCHATTSGGTYPATTGTAPGCTSCHLNGFRTPSGTSSCWDCHGASATDGRPNGSTFPNRQGRHNRSEHRVTCTKCHPFSAGDSRHGWSNRIKSTSAQVGGTGTSINSWNSATKSCQPTCHGTESWN